VEAEGTGGKPPVPSRLLIYGPAEAEP
jgi:hypothetical protein